MKETQPRRKCFILAYPVAYAAAWLVMMVRLLIHTGLPSRENGATVGNTLMGTAVFTAMGFLYFPMGILGCFVWSSRFFDNHAMVAIIFGWLAYLTVIVLGIRRPSWRLLWIFVALAVLNVAGCQFDHTADAFSWSP